MEELKAAISSMKADKIPRTDGFPIEFYVGFLDILESDLLVVAEESRVKEKSLVLLVVLLYHFSLRRKDPQIWMIIDPLRCAMQCIRSYQTLSQ